MQGGGGWGSEAKCLEEGRARMFHVDHWLIGACDFFLYDGHNYYWQFIHSVFLFK